jgi:hypothetical protein
MHTRCQCGNLKEKDNFEDLDEGKGLVLKWGLKKQEEKECTGFIWLRIGTIGGLL